jgi:pyroglutamyl-peptidase
MSTGQTPLLLVTGFEPFGGSSVNPSALLAERLSAPPGWALERRILPVDTKLLSPLLKSLLDDLKPDLILCLGEARGANVFRVETTARNRLAFQLPDNAGEVVKNEPVIQDGPALLSSTLDLEKALSSLRSLHFAANLSDDAGGFLCNQLFYSLCHRFLNSPTRVGFLHLPSLPEQGFGQGLNLESQLRAVQALVNALGSTEESP